MAKNEFLTFGMAEGANVLSNDEYAALAARVNGFSAGVAKSRELNKAWRQSSIITHILADFIAKESGNDVLDNGNIDALKSNLALAIKNALPEVRDATLTEKGIIQLSNATDSTSERLAATPRAVKYAYDLANTANNNANTRLSKSQNGADIPDKNAFVKNLGLAETVNKANSAVPSSRKVNGKALTGDISLSAGDVGALPISSTLNAQTGTLRINNGSNWPNIEFRAANKHLIGIEGTSGNRLTIYANNENGNRKYNLATPEKGGTLATLDDINVPVGVPLPYPHRYTPPGYLTCNGQTFDKSLYPKLAEAYPAGSVPDLRGEFIRGWDDGRGVDPGRVCGTWQEDAIQGHKHGYRDRYYIENAGSLSGVSHKESSPAGYNSNAGSAGTDRDNNTFLYIDSTTERAGGNETRPRNIAFNYIVRAA